MQSIIKYILSFFKRDWNLRDYPLQIIDQYPNGLPMNLPTEGSLRPIKWVVRVPGWLRMSGYGDTQDDAYSDLQRKFHEFKMEGNKLPRPGTKLPIQIASHEQIDRYEYIAQDFFPKILDMDYGRILIITDISSLWNFLHENEEEYIMRIHDVYGVDISDIEDGSLVRIFERIETEKRAHAE
jgi:hypothetical protein